jgi:hypothetical protein
MPLSDDDKRWITEQLDGVATRLISGFRRWASPPEMREHGGFAVPRIRDLWHSDDEGAWKAALDSYWTSIKPESLELEREMEMLDADVLSKVSEVEWYEFLRERYFRWKYTDARRYVTTTRRLRRYVDRRELPALDAIRRELFCFEKKDVRTGLEIAGRIHGLGIAGASGLLAVLFPAYFGTVDQFVVRALGSIPGLPENETIRQMNPDNLRLRDGVILIELMRAKAAELNHRFSTRVWTPRRVDMVLWAVREHYSATERR